MKIPFSRPQITEEDIEAVTQTLRSGWITVGPKVKEFEEALARFTGAKNAVALDSCTSALTLSATVLKKGKEKQTAVIPALTFVATANSFYHAGYELKFCDVGMDGNIDIASMEYTGKKEDVIVPVHFAGQVCAIQSLTLVGTRIIEDAAHAIGATYRGVHVGLSPYSDGACFSFYPTKNMTTIEGGAFISRHETMTGFIQKLSLHGLDSSHINRYDRSSLARPTIASPGFKANMTDIEASLGISQLKRLPDFISARRRIAQTYIAELGDKVKILKLNGRDHVWHMFIILVDNRDEFVSKLKEKEISAGIHYSPIIPAHPFYSVLTGYRRGQFPNAEYIADHCVSLPLFNGMLDEEQDYVIRCVKELL